MNTSAAGRPAPPPAAAGLDASADGAPFVELEPLAPLRRRGARPAPDPVGPWPMRLYIRAWDALLGSLPAVLMAVLAGLSWWLVRSTPGPVEAGPARALRHEPDYTMQGFSIAAYAADGQLQSRVGGAELRHYPDTDTVEIDAVRMLGFDEAGHVLQGRADRGWLQGDGSALRLSGGTVLQRQRTGDTAGAEGRLEFHSERLDVFPERKTLRSPEPVLLLDRRGEIRAGTLDYDHGRRLALLGGGVQGRFLAPGEPDRLAPAAPADAVPEAVGSVPGTPAPAAVTPTAPDRP